jgi:hypothetical protein
MLKRGHPPDDWKKLVLTSRADHDEQL